MVDGTAYRAGRRTGAAFMQFVAQFEVGFGLLDRGQTEDALASFAKAREALHELEEALDEAEAEAKKGAL